MNPPQASFKTCSPPLSNHKGHVLVLDVGTTGVKAFVFDGGCHIVGKAYEELEKMRPRQGWVEQDPVAILQACKRVLKKAVRLSKISIDTMHGLGITNQREATVLWDRKTGKPVYPLIGWEDTRTRAACRRLTTEQQALIRERTGLVGDSYFSASKIQWILKNVSLVGELLDSDRLAFGTLDTWLLWHLSTERPHLTDETNAARTLLFDVRKKRWSDDLLALFNIPRQILPEVVPTRSLFGTVHPSLVGRPIPILALCGDQQSSTYAAMRTGLSNLTKVTFGTGVFVVQPIGKTFQTHDGLFTTLIPDPRGGSSFAFENKIEGSAAHVNELLRLHKPLRPYLSRLCRGVQTHLNQLPRRPKHLVIDGGVARDGIVVEELERLNDIPSCLQTPFDGTALGTALLVWDTLENDS